MAEPRAIVPDKAIRPGLNSSGSTIGKHIAVRRSGADDYQVALPAAATDPVFGITMEAIPDGSRGDVQIDGLAVCTAGAAVAVGAEVMVTTAGKVITATTGNKIVGVANTAAAADDDLIEVELAGPSGPSVP